MNIVPRHELTHDTPKGEHLRKALDAANLSGAELMRIYPYVTGQGYTRPSDTGTLYRRIGAKINLMQDKYKQMLNDMQSVLSIHMLRRIAPKNVSVGQAQVIVLSWHVTYQEKQEKHHGKRNAQG